MDRQDQGVSTIARILVPIDLSPVGEEKLVVASAQARAFDAELILLHVLPRDATDPTGAVSVEEARSRTFLDTITSRLHAEGFRASGIVRIGSTGATIVKESVDIGIDLIVMGSSIRAGFPRVMLGSVADEVVRNATCPILLVRPHLETESASPVRSFDEDAARSGPLAKKSLGLRQVEVARVIGSVGRAHNLGANFRPMKRDRQDEQRYKHIFEGMRDGVSLPPVDLYKLGFGFYVLDGNHRVAAARELGQIEMDAEVTEFIPLGDVEAQRAFAERRAFERATGLTRIEANHAESYQTLLREILGFVEKNQPIDRREGSRRWYNQIFRPLARRIRQLSLASIFPGDRSADIIARLSAFRANEPEPVDEVDDWHASLERFAVAHHAPGGGPGDVSQRRRTISLIGR